MDWFKSEMTKTTVCAKDLSDRVSLVTELRNGLENYSFMRQGGCLVNPRTNSYCLVDAVAATTPSDFYFFTLPLGTPLPNNTTPTCSGCVQSLMEIYAGVASDTDLEISKTYPLAAERAISVCGPKYATAVDVVSAAISGKVGNMALALASGVVLGIALLF